MTRKITLEARKHFFTGRNWKQSSTQVEAGCNSTALYLHGNLIAWTDEANRILYYNLRGWNTPTTRERLNGLGLNLRTRKGQLYNEDEAITDWETHQTRF